MNQECLFCNIVKNNLKSYQVFESKNFLAILDLFPIEYGHTLVISKNHYQNFLEVPEDELSDGVKFVAKIAKKLKKILNCDGFNITTNVNRCANQVIFHFHWHIIPRYNHKPYLEVSKRVKISEKELANLQEKIVKY